MLDRKSTIKLASMGKELSIGATLRLFHGGNIRAMVRIPIDLLACCISLALIIKNLVSYLIHQSLFKTAVNDRFGGASSGY